MPTRGPILNKREKILLDVAVHFYVTLIAATIIYVKTKNMAYSGIFIAGGILIDMDHLVDYFLYFKSRINLNDLFSSTFLKSGKAYLFLHSWEIVILVLVYSFSIRSVEWFLLFLSLAMHLTIDNIQRKNPFAYLITYRILHKFDAQVLFPEKKDSP